MDTTLKNKTLYTLARLLEGHQQQIIANNKLDIESCQDLDAALLDRLKVDEKKVQGMVASVEEVIAMDDPEGKVLYAYTHANGMDIENRTVPFGTILIIYESRPDVTIEAAASAFKAGNKILLKGGKEARNTNTYLVKLWKQAIEESGVDTKYVEYLELDRATTQQLIKNDKGNIHLIIPRGGEGLIKFVNDNSQVPVIVSGRGNNFIYISPSANPSMATEIILNGKSRLSVCNALDKVLLNSTIDDLKNYVADLVLQLKEMGINVYGNKTICDLSTDVIPMPGEDMMYEEFLDAKILLSVVDHTKEAIETINRYSGGHSATIVTENIEEAEQFQYEVDCAAVYHNASTRFTDGGQFGFGAEIAISTQKLHFRGPLGGGQLVSNKWFIKGNGQIRA